MRATSEGKPEYSAIEVSSMRFWNQSFERREAVFAALRRDDPVSWQPPVREVVAPDPDDPGYWALVKHADIVAVSRNSHTFISGLGVQFDLLPPSVLEMSQSFLVMDSGRHERLRKLVSVAFSPRQIKLIEAQIRAAAREVVDGFAHEAGSIDFVDRCGKVLPIRLFCDMFGIPETLRGVVDQAAGEILGWADSETLAGRTPAQLRMQACQTLHDVCAELISHRRSNITDDLLSSLVTARVGGEQLTDLEICSIFALMSVAATDTTKHTSALTAKALSDFPVQREWLCAAYDERINLAVEEFVRFASPAMTFRRTAVRETELRGRRIMPGDKVVMFYPSGNWDRDVFTDPDRLDLARSPNPHVGFGGGGVHFCLGSHLAKSTLQELFRELLTRIPDFECGEPDLLGTNFMRGVKRLPFQFTPEKKRDPVSSR